MRKKLIIGSMMVLTVLLLMPSIPAIHLDSIQNEIEQRENINRFPEIPKKFPLLFLFVIGITYFRYARINFLLKYSIKLEEGFPDSIIIVHPILLLRAEMLLSTMEVWFVIWNNISHRLDWDWGVI